MAKRGGRAPGPLCYGGAIASGIFITLEGGEGTGKSVQARALARRLRALGVHCLLTYEPGHTLLGKHLRRILVAGGNELTPWAEMFLFAADRAQHVRKVIAPALAAGHVVVCDRFADSTIAYQHYGYGLPLEAVRRICEIASGGLVPHLTFLLDAPPEVGLSRKAKEADRFSALSPDFHQRVRQGYLALARQEPHRIVVIDASLPMRQVTELIWERLQRLPLPVGRG